MSDQTSSYQAIIMKSGAVIPAIIAPGISVVVRGSDHSVDYKDITEQEFNNLRQQPLTQQPKLATMPSKIMTNSEDQPNTGVAR